MENSEIIQFAQNIVDSFNSDDEKVFNLFKFREYLRCSSLGSEEILREISEMEEAIIGGEYKKKYSKRQAYAAPISTPSYSSPSYNYSSSSSCGGGSSSSSSCGGRSSRSC